MYTSSEIIRLETLAIMINASPYLIESIICLSFTLNDMEMFKLIIVGIIVKIMD